MSSAASRGTFHQDQGPIRGTGEIAKTPDGIRGTMTMFGLSYVLEARSEGAGELRVLRFTVHDGPRDPIDVSDPFLLVSDAVKLMRCG